MKYDDKPDVFCIGFLAGVLAGVIIYFITLSCAPAPTEAPRKVDRSIDCHTLFMRNNDSSIVLEKRFDSLYIVWLAYRVREDLPGMKRINKIMKAVNTEKRAVLQRTIAINDSCKQILRGQ